MTPEVTPTGKPVTHLKSVFEPIYVIAVCEHKASISIKGSTFITHDDALSIEQLSAVPLEQINPILESMEEERKTARQQLDYYESELEMRRLHIAHLDSEILTARNQLEIYEGQLNELREELLNQYEK